MNARAEMYKKKLDQALSSTAPYPINLKWMVDILKYKHISSLTTHLKRHFKEDDDYKRHPDARNKRNWTYYISLKCFRKICHYSRHSERKVIAKAYLSRLEQILGVEEGYHCYDEEPTNGEMKVKKKYNYLMRPNNTGLLTNGEITGVHDDVYAPEYDSDASGGEDQQRLIKPSKYQKLVNSYARYPASSQVYDHALYMQNNTNNMKMFQAPANNMDWSYLKLQPIGPRAAAINNNNANNANVNNNNISNNNTNILPTPTPSPTMHVASSPTMINPPVTINNYPINYNINNHAFYSQFNRYAPPMINNNNNNNNPTTTTTNNNAMASDYNEIYNNIINNMYTRTNKVKAEMPTFQPSSSTSMMPKYKPVMTSNIINSNHINQPNIINQMNTSNNMGGTNQQESNNSFVSETDLSSKYVYNNFISSNSYNNHIHGSNNHSNIVKDNNASLLNTYNNAAEGNNINNNNNDEDVNNDTNDDSPKDEVEASGQMTECKDTIILNTGSIPLPVPAQKVIINNHNVNIYSNHTNQVHHFNINRPINIDFFHHPSLDVSFDTDKFLSFPEGEM